VPPAVYKQRRPEESVLYAVVCDNLATLYASKHRDPFDRMLAVQSETVKLPLLTRDDALAAFPIECI
jgi:PIN domain nuclease of toxin-antitoxin system